MHGISVFGDLKYPVDFQHFDYVNVAAPKGGLFSLIPSSAWLQPIVLFTFNSLNAFILKGEGAKGMEMTFVPLMARATDEPDAMYGLAAKSVRISPDKLTLSFYYAARGTVSRRVETDRAGCRVLADFAEGKRSPADRDSVARHAEGRSPR